MILVFGGTTEGRLAIDVLEEAGKTFYYSTKSSGQDVALHNGIRLAGAMTADDIKRFCQEHDVKCIVDAAHPFAEGLHRSVADSGLPVIRLERHYADDVEGVIYLNDWSDAVEMIRCEKLLALSGVNTIAKLKSYWQRHDTIFRILNREESLGIVRQNGFPETQLLFYPSLKPTKDEEKAVMQEFGCDAILTKESGETGGFDAKVEAALELGLKVYVVRRPSLPKEWLTVSGKHTLRRAIQSLVPEFFPLKTGLTTGACATAATKAALTSLLYDDMPEEVSFALPDGETLTIPVECTQRGVASVVKEGSDDPDVTKGCRITSEVEIRCDDNCEDARSRVSAADIRFLQGEGVGIVTLPGLGIPVGEPAINPTPRQMITSEIRALTEQGVDVRISVENGRELWNHTFNNKVGVVDGISIIGTSGIVSPLSNEAFVESIGRELQVAKAIGCKEIGFASGKKGENALKEAEPELRVIHYGNFVGEALKKAYELGFQRVVIGIMIGKAIKLADGHLNTHSHVVEADLSKWGVKMARELWDVMPPSFFEDVVTNCLKHCRTVFPDGDLEVRLIRDTSKSVDEHG